MFSATSIYAQSKQEKLKIETFQEELKYEVKETDVVFTKVIEDIPGTKDEIFTNVESWLAKAYKNSKEVIQQKDKDAGIFIGKGNFEIYKRTVKSISGIQTVYCVFCSHIIQINVKENKVRMILSVNNSYDKVNGDGSIVTIWNLNHYPIINYYPFTSKAIDSPAWFIGLCETVKATFDSLEKSLKESSSLTNPNDDW